MKILIYIFASIIFLPILGLIMMIPVLNVIVISKLMISGEEEEE